MAGACRLLTAKAHNKNAPVAPLLVKPVVRTLTASSSSLLLDGRPRQKMSFFSLEMMSIAMSTLSASYTRRLMFFSS